MGCPRGDRVAKLFTDVQAAQQIDVSLWVVTTHVVQQTAATANHSQQTATASIIFGVAAHMFGQVIDAAGQNGDLHSGGSSVLLAGLEIGDRFRLCFFSDCHCSINFLQTSCVIKPRNVRRS